MIIGKVIIPMPHHSSGGAGFGLWEVVLTVTLTLALIVVAGWLLNRIDPDE